jgi:hypothetical protein
MAESGLGGVRFGSEADILRCENDVCFTPKSRRVQCTRRCPLSANSGHSQNHPRPDAPRFCRNSDQSLDVMDLRAVWGGEVFVEFLQCETDDFAKWQQSPSELLSQ